MYLYGMGLSLKKCSKLSRILVYTFLFSTYIKDLQFELEFKENYSPIFIIYLNIFIIVQNEMNPLL